MLKMTPAIKHKEGTALLRSLLREPQTLERPKMPLRTIKWWRNGRERKTKGYMHNEES